MCHDPALSLGHTITCKPRRSPNPEVLERGHGKMGEMGGNWGKWRKRGNHQQIRIGIVGKTSGVGEKLEKNGMKCPIFKVPFSVFFWMPKTFPSFPL